MDRTSRRLWPAILAIASLAVPAAAGKVVIVRSSGLPLYESVAAGFLSCSKSQIVGDFTLTGDASRDEAVFDQARGKAPDVVITLGTTATRAVREKWKAVPSVFAVVIDPTSNDIAPPGVPLDLRASTQLEFIRQYFPQFKRVGVLYSPGRNREVVAELKALKAKGAPVILEEVVSIEKLDSAVQSLSNQADCLLMLSDPILYSPQTAPQLILQTLQRGMPIIAASPAYVKAGALAGIYSAPIESGCLAAGVADRIMAGEKASSFSWPEKYLSVVNLIVAGRLKVQVPAALTNSAEQVIK
jgi:putative tryptophan/tyrosine transport system substrate-binding protein